jgi:hypothetical protein
MEEIHFVASETMELISSITYFSRKHPKSRHYMFKCVTWPPASQLAAPGHTPFPKFKKMTYVLTKTGTMATDSTHTVPCIP